MLGLFVFRKERSVKIVYIDDFSKDLSDKKVIFYIGCVDYEMLYEKLSKDGVIGKYEKGIYFQDILDNNLMFIQSGKISDVDMNYAGLDNSFSTLMEDGYMIVALYYNPIKRVYFIPLHDYDFSLEGDDMCYENSSNKLDSIRP